jgi:hypothetical protein
MQRLLKVGIIDINTNHPSYSSLEKTLSVLRNAKKFNLDIIVGPEWGLMNNNLIEEKPYSYKELDSLLNSLREITSQTKTLVLPGSAVIYTKNMKMYNFLPVLYNGKIIFSTIKSNDGGTSFFNTGQYELIGRDYSINKKFQWDNLEIGIEICADSGSLYREEKRNLDLQVLVSSGLRITNLAVKKEGYLVCSDGYPHGKKTYVLKTNKDYDPDSNTDLSDFRDLFKKKELDHKLTKEYKDKMPFEFISNTRHKNLNVYQIEMDF